MRDRFDTLHTTRGLPPHPGFFRSFDLFFENSNFNSSQSKNMIKTRSRTDKSPKKTVNMQKSDISGSKGAF